MNEQNDENQNYALMVLAGLIFLVVGGVIALAAYRGTGGATPQRESTTAAVSAVLAGEPEGRVYFDLGSDALPADAAQVLDRVARAAAAQSGKMVLISGFHDASGDAATNAELAKKRAQAVRQALAADGVAVERLVLDKPVMTTGNGDAREARRVELRLR